LVIETSLQIFMFYFCPALNLTISISLTIQCIVCLHSTVGAGYFFLTKVSAAFSPLHVYTLQITAKHTAEQQTSLTCTGLLYMKDSTQSCKCIKFGHG